MDVFAFLQKHQIAKGNEHTHTSFIKPTGAFYIPVNEQDEFYNLYRACMKKGDELYITEKHRDHSPILIDLDFRYEKTDSPPQRYHTENDIKIIVNTYLKIIEKYVTISDYVEIYVMEKSAPVIDKTYVKDGIHIVIPDIVTTPEFQYIVRNEVLKVLPSQLNLPVLNSWEDIIDEAIIQKNNWMMYGSRKPHSEPYKIKYIYSKDLEEYEIQEDDFNYVDILSIRNKFDITETNSVYEEALKKYQTEKQNKFTKKLSNNSIFQQQQNMKKNTVTDLGYIKKLVFILKKERAESYPLWIRLGWCLRNIDYRLLDTWDEFSRQSSKYREGECERIWNYMKDDGLNVGSLHLWAKEDNPEEYKEIAKKDLFALVSKSCTGTHTDIAQVIHFMYKYEYVCVSVKNNYWYEFKNHRWQPCDSGHSLRSKISNELCQEYYHQASIWATKAANESDEEHRKNYGEKVKKLNEIALKLKTTNFKDNLIKESRELFYIEKFEDKLDSRCQLIGFENGVFDLDCFEFREGRPEDYISFTTGVDYIPYQEDENSKNMHEFIDRVFPKPHMKEYYLLLLASFMNGSIKEEKFHIFTGGGSNGKSACIDLFEQSFGDYCCKLPITLLTQKRAASNAATSELARTKGKRFACLQEPSEDEKLNVGLMKELTGGDRIMARQIYREPIEFKPQFKMVLTCNQLPTVPANDNGTWRRLRVLEFTSKFCENPNPENPLEFHMDMDLAKKFEIWKQYFIALLIQYYKKYLEIGITEPDEVLICTREYQRNNDVYLDFIEQELERDDMAFTSYNQIFNSFRSWLKDNNLPHVSVKKKEVMTNLNKTLGKTVIFSTIEGYKGWQFKTHTVAINDDLS